MAKRIWQLLPVLFISFSVAAQSKVANYSFGEGGSNEYEYFSFWIKNKKHTDITYSYGADRKETTVKYLGKTVYKNDNGFKIQFANQYILYIIPKGNQLQVSDSSGRYKKTFNWEYEGPVNGVGTFCDVCTKDEKEAMTLLRLYYLK